MSVRLGHTSAESLPEENFAQLVMLLSKARNPTLFVTWEYFGRDEGVSSNEVLVEITFSQFHCCLQSSLFSL